MWLCFIVDWISILTNWYFIQDTYCFIRSNKVTDKLAKFGLLDGEGKEEEESVTSTVHCEPSTSQGSAKVATYLSACLLNYLLTYFLTYLPSYLLTHPTTYLPTYFLTHLPINLSLLYLFDTIMGEFTNFHKGSWRFVSMRGTQINRSRPSGSDLLSQLKE